MANPATYGAMAGPVASPPEPAAGAILLFAGRRIRLPGDGLEIGRDDDCGLTIRSELVSRRHARIYSEGGRLFVADLGSTNGTRLNGRDLGAEPCELASGDTVEVGGEPIRLVAGGEATSVEPRGVAPARSDTVEMTVERMTIGRDPACDLVLRDPNVSRVHAEIVRTAEGLEVRDLSSRNGLRVDGRRVAIARLDEGAEVRIGAYALTIEGSSLLTRDDHGALCLEAAGVTVETGGTRILAPASLCVEPGELVAVIGRSGGGKTTLMKALAGVTEPSAGSVTLGGEPIEARVADVGYLPQDEVVHPSLTPREALRYAARLRLPPDLSRQEMESAIAETLEELSLSHAADRRIGTLSGGERKRAGLAVELLGRPSVLFLDEPTTGLDPGLETQTMRLLRDLAGGERSVVVVTHTTRSLDLCDRVIVVGPGGRIHANGAPQEVLERFGVEDFDDIYDRVAEAPDPPTEDGSGEPASGPGGRRRRPRAPFRTQAWVLVRRYARVLSRDRRNLTLLVLQAPVLGAAIGALFGAEVFSRAKVGNPNDAAQVLFLLVTTSIWMGAIGAAREVIKERAVVARERAAGVRLGAYLTSKLAVLGALALLQAGLLLAAATALISFHAVPTAYAGAYAILAGTALAAVAMGLAISAAARSEDQAMSYIPLALLPQLLFAGAIVPVSKMGAAMDTVSQTVFARWSFSGLGTELEMNSRLAADEFDSKRSPYGRDFFVVETWETALALAAFVAVFTLATALLLRRRTARGG